MAVGAVEAILEGEGDGTEVVGDETGQQDGGLSLLQRQDEVEQALLLLLAAPALLTSDHLLHPLHQ